VNHPPAGWSSRITRQKYRHCTHWLVVSRPCRQRFADELSRARSPKNGTFPCDCEVFNAEEALEDAVPGYCDLPSLPRLGASEKWIARICRNARQQLYRTSPRLASSMSRSKAGRLSSSWVIGSPANGKQHQQRQVRFRHHRGRRLLMYRHGSLLSNA